MINIAASPNTICKGTVNSTNPSGRADSAGEGAGPMPRCGRMEITTNIITTIVKRVRALRVRYDRIK